jgi:micrococcal nuclease
MYEYKCKIKRVVDGDTVDVDIDLGFNNWMMNQRVRLVGIDAPESRTRDLEEKEFGNAAKQFVEELLPVGSDQVMRSYKDNTGKFGRILGDFVFGDTTLTNVMLAEHHAVPYGKENSTELHLENRRILAETTRTYDRSEILRRYDRG